MTYTTQQAVQLALECWKNTNSFEEYATALCNKVRTQTLLEAAETWETIGYSKFKTPAEELRRMVGVE